MDEVIEYIHNISAMGEAISILAVAPRHLAGELSPHSFQRIGIIITILCDRVIEEINRDRSTALKGDFAT